MSRKPVGHGMTQVEFTADEIGARCGWWCRAAWKDSRRKRLAALLSISEEQAKRILLGARPTTAQIAILARHFGWRFVHFVLEPAAGPIPVYQPSEELQELRARLDRVERQVGGVDAWSVAPMGSGLRPVAAPDVAPEGQPLRREGGEVGAHRVPGVHRTG
jgi:hypothetical protein